MQFVEIEVSQFVEELWRIVLGLAVRRRAGAVVRTGRYVTGVVSIRGAWQGAVRLECSEPLARQAAGVMFGLEPGAVSEAEVLDAVRELTNITAGNLKSVLPGPCELGLPAVTQDPSSAGADSAITRLGFECAGNSFFVSLEDPSRPH